jgi:hypothetical protein
MKNLLGYVSRSLGILETDGELVLGKEMVFRNVATSATRILQGQLATDVIVECTTTINAFVLIYYIKYLISEGTDGIGDNKPAKAIANREGNRMRGRGKM